MLIVFTVFFLGFNVANAQVEFYSFNRDENLLLQERLEYYDRGLVPITDTFDNIQVHAKGDLVHIWMWQNNVMISMKWFLKWTDHHWKWDPSHYDGLNQTSIPASLIWVPSLFPIFTKAMDDSNMPLIRDESTCFVKSNGEIQMALRINWKGIQCIDTEIHHKKSCHLLIGQYHPSKEITAMILKEDMDFESSEHDFWQISNTELTRTTLDDNSNEQEDIFNLTFTMTMNEMYSGKMLLWDIHPGIMIGLMTAVQFLIPPRRYIRNILTAVFIMLCTSSLSQYSAWLDPDTRLLRYFTCILFLNFIAFIWNVTYSNIWLHPGSLTDRISLLLLPTAQKFSKYIMIPTMDSKSDNVHDKWMLITQFIDRIFFLVYLLVIIILIVTLDSAEKIVS